MEKLSLYLPELGNFSVSGGTRKLYKNSPFDGDEPESWQGFVRESIQSVGEWMFWLERDNPINETLEKIQELHGCGPSSAVNIALCLRIHCHVSSMTMIHKYFEVESND